MIPLFTAAYSSEQSRAPQTGIAAEKENQVSAGSTLPQTSAANSSPVAASSSPVAVSSSPTAAGSTSTPAHQTESAAAASPLDASGAGIGHDGNNRNC